jgi:AhpD family alkylhydroperoxidase
MTGKDLDMLNSLRTGLAGIALAAALPLAAAAQSSLPSYEATLADIEATWGFVPSFVEKYPKALLPGAWANLRAIDGTDTMLDAKVKALISVAVASQIPCQYCVWLDTNAAYLAGASQEEVLEAVAVAGTTRAWSAFLYGSQTDMTAFREEFAGLAEAAEAARMKTEASN